MIFSSLYKAIKTKEKLAGKNSYNVFHDSTYFGVVAFQLMQSADDWPQNASSLLDASKWDHNRLSVDHGKFRKPKIFLETSITNKGNLVLEWYPSNPSLFNMGTHDFPQWSREGFDPENRIVIVREFRSLIGLIQRKDRFDEADQRLVETVKMHLTQINTTLNCIFDVSLGTELILEYQDVGTPSKKYLTKAQIA